MKVFITIPSWTNPHGGLRVIMEWANRITKWHDVYLCNLKEKELPCEWFKIDEKVQISTLAAMWECDCVILTSPHSVNLLDLVLPNQKCFLFLQMLEHLFSPNDVQWLKDCKRFYEAPYPMFSISQWNIDEVKRFNAKRFIYNQGEIGEVISIPGYHYIGNGVNLDDFPISNKPKDGKTVLIEGWECANPSKDSDFITHKVAARLKDEGFKIIAYGGRKLKTDGKLLDEYHLKPNIETLNSLYERATILIKASKYDARSCSPMEAMTKGTVTARAIIEGDDDLDHKENCLRCGYDADELYTISKNMLTDTDLREMLASNCIKHVQQYSWDYWMNIINEKISDN